MNWDYLESSEEEKQAYAAGRNTAIALCSLFQVHAGVGISGAINLARRLARWEGYRSGDSAISYLNGFVDGFQSSQPKQIEGSKDE